MKTSDILVAAKELLSDPSRWTKGALARNENGEQISYNATTATCWCTVGAVARVAKENNQFADPVMEILTEVASPLILTEYNDAAQHYEIMYMFNLAIDVARNRENV